MDSTDSDEPTEPAGLATYSLLINDDPLAAFKLMSYLKYYSELLFAWGDTSKAI
jgi:hypothetical protein